MSEENIITIKEFEFLTRARNVLGSHRDTELLRSELFSIEQLKRHAIQLASQHRLDPDPGDDKLLPRLADNEKVLLGAYEVVTTAVLPGQRVIAAEAWLLDNFYLIEQQIELARTHLPRGYSRQLPRLAGGASAGFPRIYDLALELISHMDGRVDIDNATHIIAAYQTVEPLKLGELWAFPIMLQLALLENLRRVALHIAHRREELDAAVTWADRMLATSEKEPKLLIQLLADFANADVPLTAPFVEEFYARLQAQGPTMAFVQTWVEQKLIDQGVTAIRLSEVEGRKAAANQISIANSISSLRFIGVVDWKNYVELLSVVEETLRKDPAGAHANQDFATRDRYRHVIEDVARVSKYSVSSELAVANEVVFLALVAAAKFGVNHRTAHIGYYLIDEGRYLLESKVGCRLTWQKKLRKFSRHYCLALYLTPMLMLTMLATSIMLSAFHGLDHMDWRLWLLGVVGFTATSAAAVSLVNQFATLIFPPKSLPRLDFSCGIPAQHRTMVVIPTLIHHIKEIDNLLEALEIRYLGNRDPNLYFALLTDFRDSTVQSTPEDEVLLNYAKWAIQTMNETYRDDRACVFYLFHRPRTWNPHDSIWMGYERKRGKLEQFNSLLRGGEKDAFSEIVGDNTIFSSVKYVITLDTDTQLPRDAAFTLVGNMAHPLNRPVYDKNKGRVVEGYAILQPRATISLNSAGQTWFAKLFAGDTGIDPYTREVSDVYQDIFGEGSFIGKGIYDVDAFRLAVDGRFPENLILSHDLLESGYARSALVTDVDLIEEHPASYVIEASRRHRWIRGDWQLTAWLLANVPSPFGADAKKEVNPLTPLLTWKIFDNLRRSLVAPALLMLLIGGWLLSPESALFWTCLVIGLVFLPSLVSTLIDIVRKPEDRTWLEHYVLIGSSAKRPLLLALMTLILLPYDALICVDAIFRSGVRMLFTRRGLLCWHLTSYTKRNAKTTLLDFAMEMWIAPTLALVMTLIFVVNWPAAFLYLLPIVLLWLISPVVAWWISLPLVSTELDLTHDQQLFLRGVARRTWQFFAEFVTPLDNYLAPDNFQEYPTPTIASRTSPTNIGMSLLANLSACDFGYISTADFLQLSANTFTTMEKLGRFHGHFYNWYDTRSLAPLHPSYVSSVDSGNLAGCLLTLQAGLAELKNQPVFQDNVFKGLQDTLQILSEYVSTLASESQSDRMKLIQGKLATFLLHDFTTNAESLPLLAASKLLDEINEYSEYLTLNLSTDSNIESGLHYWAQVFNKQIQSVLKDFSLLTTGLNQISRVPTLLELAGKLANSEVINESTILSLESSAKQRIEVIDALIERCRKLAVMDFEFLYDKSSDLLSIGYDVGERRRDLSCYDLLASEARIASFMLIAQGQVPQKHWFSLGRLLTSFEGRLCLISWSGSMFEYLMPQLLMPSYTNTLLEQTCKTAVLRQIAYARKRSVPWGISESCYNATDLSQVYQYRAFGVPGLGFKRGLGDDLVIAPYASALALTVMPVAACQNMQTLATNGFLGQYGFYEAIDYTPSRVQRGKNHAVVRSFMAHHQGMSLLGLAYVLHNKPMQRRFTASPLVQATELLLQERVPKKGFVLQPHAAEVRAVESPQAIAVDGIMRVFTDPNTAVPEVHLLSNGRYHVVATNAGSGYSRWRDLAVTRWREDATSDSWGTFIYLRDTDTGSYWSTTYQPTLNQADHYEAIFVQARAEYRRRDHAIEAHTEVCVSPEDDVEIRRVTLTNLSSRSREIEITSYAEVVLATLNSDLAHRAFSNLFVQTEILHEKQAILCTRRPRTSEEKVSWMFHLFAAPGCVVNAPTYETDRAKFIGRGRTAANPEVLEQTGNNALLSNSEGSVLDPIVAIRRNVKILPDESACVQIVTGVAETRETALALIDKYCDKHFVGRAFEMSWFQSQEVLRHLNATETDAQAYGRLASSIIYSSFLRRATPSDIARNQLKQAGLWRFGISGDLPIVLLRIGNLNRMDLVKQVLQAHAYWRIKGLVADLVIVNEDFSGYRASLQEQIMGLINSGSEAQIIDKPGGIFVRRVEELSEDERILLQTVARIVFTDTTETLIEQLERRVSSVRKSDLMEIGWQPIGNQVSPLKAKALIFSNGLGGFTPDGREYVVMLEAGQSTPAPWVNVIASSHIGTVVSESGSAYTWVENAHEFRLTPWQNDPISDSSGEALYIRDEDTGAFWSPSPLPACGRSGYVCRHGFGYSVFEHEEAGIFSEMSTYVAMDAPVKFVVIKLINNSKHTRRLSLTAYWELVLGEWRHTNLMHIATDVDLHSGAVFATNPYGRECANRVVFAQVSESERSVTGSRTEFIGRNSLLSNPAAMRRKRLSGKTGAGLDPCAALQTKIDLEPGQHYEVVFTFGAAHSTEQAQRLIEQFSRPAGARLALEAVWEYWNHTLGAVQVETPNVALNVLTNGWLIYQTLSCRLWGRSGYYQSGGAYGYRDQLQDTMALIHTTPWLAREQLLRCAEHQFIQGDVQHWWHPPNGQGVRTHFSDDYLWLPYAMCRYVLATGDSAVLSEQVHFLDGRELKPEEEAYYDQPQRSSKVASLYEHCVRAIKHGLRFGQHELPLMGCGDWNDGMNLVGRDGKGESVWLAWFLYDNLRLFSVIAHGQDDAAFADDCSAQAIRLRENIEKNAWDGAWYRRAYFDDGTALGSSANVECQIDSISQSWAIISKAGDSVRARLAMKAVNERLVKRDAQLIQLLEPPFDKSELEPGYIKGYVPGVRENGGQYTHAAIWATMAFAQIGENQRAWELFEMLNPINHGSDPDQIQRYKVEPYVMSADIYAAPPHTGRGGWTWYTGAAGWMYRLSVETLLGLHLEVDKLCISPCVPVDWLSYKIHYRFRDTQYHIIVNQVLVTGTHQHSVTIDGVRIEGEGPSVSGNRQVFVPLVDDRKEHNVEIEYNGISLNAS
jgi:cyclic beta-1,2-glucan synthetase